ncbi:hypothetical protein EJ04DRAFT_310440 [Polyplosphaeria fusca]|uniref:Uncharacterized protein n=1 Tax=Polyplosphaeria fusca TaxID=682080 RepID=A0A9P4R5T4_9PLEO|nr:hypothetical protein EJ04DRAFT_310440 [Polyplosphaeria fusca]
MTAHDFSAPNPHTPHPLAAADADGEFGTVARPLRPLRPSSSRTIQNSQNAPPTTPPKSLLGDCTCMSDSTPRRYPRKSNRRRRTNSPCFSQFRHIPNRPRRIRPRRSSSKKWPSLPHSCTHLSHAAGTWHGEHVSRHAMRLEPLLFSPVSQSTLYKRSRHLSTYHLHLVSMGLAASLQDKSSLPVTFCTPSTTALFEIASSSHTCVEPSTHFLPQFSPISSCGTACMKSLSQRLSVLLHT